MAQFSLAERPILSWRWKVSRLVAAADNSKFTRKIEQVTIALK
jgi:hypothetical protein